VIHENPLPDIRDHCADYITVTYPYEDDNGPVEISRFDANSMSQVYSSTLKEFSKEHLRSALYADNRLFLICSNKEGAVTRWEINDRTGAISGSSVLLFSLQAKEQTEGIIDGFVPPPTYYTGTSGNSSYNYLVVEEDPRKGKGKLLEGVIFDRQLNKLSTFSYITPEEVNGARLAPRIIVSDNGDLSMIYATVGSTKKEDYTPLVYFVLQVDTKGKTTNFQLSGQPSGFLANVDCFRRDDRLILTGWLAPEKNSDFRRLFRAELIDGEKKLTDARTLEVGSIALGQPGYLHNGVASLPIDASLRYSFALPDGGRILTLEVTGATDYTRVTTYSDGSRSHMSYNTRGRGYVYILKMDRTGTPSWLNVISKGQSDAEFVVEAGIVCTMSDDGTLHVFFYDRAKNAEPLMQHPATTLGQDFKTNEFACVSIAPGGTMKKQFIPLENHEFRMMPEKARPLHNNEFVFTRLHQKPSFSPAGVFKHGAFRFGVIRVK